MSKIVYAVLGAVVVAAIVVVMMAQRQTGSDADRKLVTAAQNDDIEAMKAALEAGANVNYQIKSSTWDGWFGKESPDEGYSALHYSAQRGSLAGATLLVEKGADVNVKNAYQNTPLMLAVSGLHTSVVELLLSHKADPNVKNQWGSTALDFSKKRLGGATEGAALGKLIEAAGGVAGTPQEPGGGGGGGG